MPRTNREVSRSPEFVALCAEHGVKPTKRQVSKFALGKGLLRLKGARPSDLTRTGKGEPA